MERGRKLKTIKCRFDRFDCGYPFNRPWPFIFIARGGLAPLGVKTLTKACKNTTPNSYLAG
jgi:hypothetical protein